MQPATFRMTPTIRQEIVKIVDARIKEAHVTKEDFSELKSIVKELAEAQKRTEIKVEELAEAQKRTEIKVEELAEAQKRTEIKIEELAEAQKRTEIRVEELAEAQKRTETKVEELAEAQTRTEAAVAKLAEGVDDLRKEVGGIGRSAGYALENEAYRHLPEVLKTKDGIAMKEKIIRASIRRREINIFGRAEREGREVFVVGESKIRLEKTRKKDPWEVFEELEEKIAAVTSEYGQVEIVKVLVTHFATEDFLVNAQNKGVIVVQSFEW
ncbi:hypothetical protein HUU05_00840 [candidate division KSB1 bacterium]|nr:hypothetical protein [candidate division KSB1 bacterium]